MKVLVVGCWLLVATLNTLAAGAQKPPNVLFLLVDDWGAGDVDMCPPDIPYDLCPFRSTTDGRKSTLHTPRIKRMASEGQILTNFYAPRAICTPSRAGYLSGRDPARYGLVDELFRILPSSSARGGFPQSEKSVAEYMKELGYATGYSGKWHMGQTNGIDPAYYTPINHGFDDVRFFVEGSNGEQCEAGALNPPDDNNIYHMCTFDHIQNCDSKAGTCEVVEQPIRWENVTARHLEVTKDFINQHKDDESPWFYQHSFLHVHVPWVPGRYFVTDPQLKFWTDMVGEVDWAVGVILQHLRDLSLDENTLVVLSSDNGPYMESASSWCPQNCRWLTPEAAKSGVPDNAGCTPCASETVSLPGPYSGGKGNTWEGGQRVPSIWWWPGSIPAGTVNPIVASGLDLLPTFVSLAGGETDADIALDGRDISFSVLSETDPAAEPEGSFVYWCGTQVNAVRTGKFKTIWFTQDFVTDMPDHKTPPYLCGQTGQCCAGGPSRLCTCVWGTRHDPPFVIDLSVNPSEDLGRKLDSSSNITQEIIKAASAILLTTVQSVLEDRSLSTSQNVVEMLNLLSATPNYPQVDICLSEKIPMGPFFCDGIEYPMEIRSNCGLLPEACQQSILPGQSESFYPFDNCTISGSYQGPKCAKRLPCCTQEGYMGPFEYVRPTGDTWEDGNWQQCGCFNNGETSYFPDDQDLQESVCQWQDDVLADLKANNLTIPFGNFCRLPACANRNPNNDEACHVIAKYGLSNVPTGNIFNSPYPDTQYDESLRYLNQKVPPGGTGAQTTAPTPSTTSAGEMPQPEPTPSPTSAGEMPQPGFLAWLIAAVTVWTMRG